MTADYSNLNALENESISILREAAAVSEKPVLLYSIGKDSSVLLHLAKKAFYPGKIPFPLLHIDTTWKFSEMISFRDNVAADPGIEMIVYTNRDGLNQNITPFTHGSTIYTDVMKTQALRQALSAHGFDIAIGGARRDEEKSRAKERIFSFRDSNQRWNPKEQRPEPWQLYNTIKGKGESFRVFPLSNWTELDVWHYIAREKIEVVPLYFAKERPVVERDGTMIMVDDARLPLHPGERPHMRKIRFRTLGCYPLTGAMVSDATTIDQIIDEMKTTRNSERQGRIIDHDGVASMEHKKQEGYF